MKFSKDSKQLAVLKCIYEEVNEHGYPPTVREICQAVGLSSTSTVHGHLSRLEKNGFIQRDPTKPRAIEVTPLGLSELGIEPNHHKIPNLGIVTAGSPILAVEEVDTFFPIPPEYEHLSNELFMLTIRGDSMINAGIFDGDQVFVRKQNYASNGEIVIALTEEEEATCKRFYKEQGHIRLQPENDRLEPIILPNVHILGKVIGLYRSRIW